MIKADSTPILYIIISIVLMIISVLGKNKKKGMQHPVPHTDKAEPEMNQPAPKPSWQKELEEIFGNVFEETPAPKKTLREEQERAGTVVENPLMSKRQVPETEINEAESLEDIIDETKIQYQAPVIQTAQVEEESKKIELEEIELEKAIIYSEVINRKYF